MKERLPHILVVEDEPAMLLGIRDNLEFEGYQVSTARNGKDGLQMINSFHYDLIILDIMMPLMSGYEVCKSIRRNGIETPVIFLSAKGEEIDKVLGLEFGADDYITKPFGLRELLARIKAILRRSQTASTHNEIIQIGHLQVDFERYQATKNGTPVKMSIKEFDILHYMYQHKNEAVSRNDLLEKVWGVKGQPTTRTVDNFILKLRQKVETDPNQPSIILTLHGIGYKLILD